jgi:hypothetical protein
MKTTNKVNIEQCIEAGHDEENAGKVAALCQHLECEPDELTQEAHTHYDLTVYSYGKEEYAVGTDEEADTAWDQSLDSYIEECITPELDKLSENAGTLGNYVTFNEEMWKRDAKMDGRGHSLSSYDSNEEEIQVGDTIYAIFRIN